jgi:hypothetical protein
MIRHIVLVQFDAEAAESERQAIFADLARLEAVVPGMREFRAGANNSPEGLDRGFTHAFTIDFDNTAARDAYLAHPDHRTAGARLVGAAAGGVDGLLVLDVEF